MTAVLQACLRRNNSWSVKKEPYGCYCSAVTKGVRRGKVRRNFFGKDQLANTHIDTAENCAIKIRKLAKFESDTSEAFEDVAPESRE